MYIPFTHPNKLINDGCTQHLISLYSDDLAEDALHYTGHVMKTISAVQNYSSTTNYDDGTPLHYACLSNSEATAQLLLEHHCPTGEEC